LSDAELDILIEELRTAAAAWFNDKMLLKLEELIRETKRARQYQKDHPSFGDLRKDWLPP
jgi:hypothetical protein